MGDAATAITPSMSHEADVEKYFERTGFSGARDCNLDTLKKIMWCHYKTFPFENLSVMLKQPIVIELKAIEKKFINQLRGGYCFEHAILLDSILRQLGYNVTTLIARVVMTPGAPSPNTHAALLVVIDGQNWLVDCWFGPYGSTSPLLISDDTVEFETMTCKHRVIRKGDYFAHQAEQSEHMGAVVEGWEDLYLFNLTPALLCDYQVSSWFVETHPESFFFKNILVSKFTEDKRFILFNNYFKYRMVGPGSSSEDLGKLCITTQDEYLSVLAEYFDQRFPEGMVLCPPGVVWESK